MSETKKPEIQETEIPELNWVEKAKAASYEDVAKEFGFDDEDGESHLPD